MPIAIPECLRKIKTCSSFQHTPILNAVIKIHRKKSPIVKNRTPQPAILHIYNSSSDREKLAHIAITRSLVQLSAIIHQTSLASIRSER